MLRKALYFLLGLMACAVVLAAFDGVRHAQAVARLDKHFAAVDDWRYRLVNTQAPRRIHVERGLGAGYLA